MSNSPTDPIVAAAGYWFYIEANKPTEGGTYLVRCANRAHAWYDVMEWNGMYWSKNQSVTHWARLNNPMGEQV